MTVQGVSSTGSSSQTGQNSSLSNIGKDQFLQIMMTQLKYQNPLDPLKADEFLAQLSQMTQVEQLTNIAGSLDGMKQTADRASVTQWLSVIGKKVQVESSTLSKGDEIDIKPQGDYDSVTLKLMNTTDGSVKEVKLGKGESLEYKYDGEADVAVSVSAVKANRQVQCGAEVFKVARGVDIGDGKVVVLVGNNEAYGSETIRRVKDL